MNSPFYNTRLRQRLKEWALGLILTYIPAHIIYKTYHFFHPHNRSHQRNPHK